MSRHAKPPASPPAPALSPPPLACLRPQGEGALLLVSVVPNAKRTELVGLHDGALRVRLAAPPVDGKANDCLTAWLAEELGLPKRAVSLVRGQTARVKQLQVDAAPAVVVRWLQAGLDALDAAG